MVRVFITGSADGLGRAAAQTLLDDGHEILVHVRNSDRLEAVRDLMDRGAAVVVGDLSDLEQTHAIARDVNRVGRMDAVIHNAGVYTGPAVLPVNIVAPYLLTALIDRPQRLVYLSSGLHRSGQPSLTSIDWSGRRAGSYPDSKLFVTTLAVAVARLWPDLFSNAVDPAGCRREWADPARPTTYDSDTSRKNGLPPATTPTPVPQADTGVTSAGSNRIPPPAIRSSRTTCSTTSRASRRHASSDLISPIQRLNERDETV